MRRRPWRIMMAEYVPGYHRWRDQEGSSWKTKNVPAACSDTIQSGVSQLNSCVGTTRAIQMQGFGVRCWTATMAPNWRVLMECWKTTPTSLRWQLEYHHRNGNRVPTKGGKVYLHAGQRRAADRILQGFGFCWPLDYEFILLQRVSSTNWKQWYLRSAHSVSIVEARRS